MGFAAILVIAGGLAWVAMGGSGKAGDTAHNGGGVSLDPAVFATGACELFPPTHGDNGRTIFLDAGHGGPDPGALGSTSSGTSIDEAAEALPVELDATAALEAAGYHVVVSRTGDTPVVRLKPADISGSVLSLQGSHDDVAARSACADTARAQLLVGIYFDSGGSSADAGSLTTYDAVRPFSASNLRFARLLQQDVLTAMNGRGWDIPNAGVTVDSQEGSLVPSDGGSRLAVEAANYGHLLLLGPADPGYNPQPSTMPGAVIEPLFITDPFEATIAASSSGQSVIAEGIANAVQGYFGPSRTTAHR